jgi:predicted permease
MAVKRKDGDTCGMTMVLVEMGLLILCGAAFGIIRPGELTADQSRHVLTTLVFNLLMPAMVLSVLWQVKLGLETLKISLYGMAIVVFGAAATWLIARPFRPEPRRLGAAMLGIAFPNVTYLGLPVLERTFGAWTRAIVIQIDLLAALPMVLTLGVFIARYYGQKSPHETRRALLNSLLRNPPLWAAFLALSLNLAALPMPTWLEQTLTLLADAVIPLMLISLGLGLRWEAWRWRNLPLASLVIVLRLALVPLFGLGLALELGFEDDKLAALVMEAGMPCMLLGVVYCDQWKLDTAFYAMIVALSTAASLITLPAWRYWAATF